MMFNNIMMQVGTTRWVKETQPLVTLAQPTIGFKIKCRSRECDTSTSFLIYYRQWPPLPPPEYYINIYYYFRYILRILILLYILWHCAVSVLLWKYVYLPLFLPLNGQHAFPAFLAVPAKAAFRVYPLEALGQYVADVGQVKQE